MYVGNLYATLFALCLPEKWYVQYLLACCPSLHQLQRTLYAMTYKITWSKDAPSFPSCVRCDICILERQGAEAGIIGFHKWFVQAFPTAITDASHPSQVESFDHVCIDMNQASC